MMKGVVATSGIATEDVEDVAMDILARFIEKDGIAYYDPNHLHDVGEHPDLPGARLRKAKFKGMLRGFTSIYVMQYRDKQMLRHRREPWRLEKPVNERGDTWYETNFSEQTEDLTFDAEVSVSLAQCLREAYTYLEAHKSSSIRDYRKFISLCIEHGYLDGKLDRKALAEALGISSSTVTNMVRELRTVLRPLLEEAGIAEAA